MTFWHTRYCCPVHCKACRACGLQLLATWVCNKHRPEDSVSKTLVDDTISTVWCGESLTSARMYT